MIQQMYTIKEAAKELGVEAHALRYWEEELNLTIDRNAQGRRVYTEENIQLFRDIMGWKEQGLQLKSIKEMIHGKATDKGLSGSRDELTGHRIIVYRIISRRFVTFLPMTFISSPHSGHFFSSSLRSCSTT